MQKHIAINADVWYYILIKSLVFLGGRESVKKYLYYVIPFVWIPILMQLCECLDNIGFINMSPHIALIAFVLSCAVIGIFSPTNKSFDCVMTVIMPFALFCVMFTFGFLDKGDLGTTPLFSMERAFKVAFQPLCLIAYCVMAVTTFLSSFKKIRVIKKLKSY